MRIVAKSSQAFSLYLAKMDTLPHCIFNAYEISSITLDGEINLIKNCNARYNCGGTKTAE